MWVCPFVCRTWVKMLFMSLVPPQRPPKVPPLRHHTTFPRRTISFGPEMVARTHLLPKPFPNHLPSPFFLSPHLSFFFSHLNSRHLFGRTSPFFHPFLLERTKGIVFVFQSKWSFHGLLGLFSLRKPAILLSFFPTIVRQDKWRWERKKEIAR